MMRYGTVSYSVVTPSFDVTADRLIATGWQTHGEPVRPSQSDSLCHQLLLRVGRWISAMGPIFFTSHCRAMARRQRKSLRGRVLGRREANKVFLE
jgi:hypothetical protein